MEKIKGFTLKELEERILEEGEQAFRARQIFKWVYQRGADEFPEMTDISRKFRSRLEQLFEIPVLRLVDKIQADDKTTRFLFQTYDGKLIESVWIPDYPRFTLCVSTQAGCALGCAFCATGKLGLSRNLKAAEIVDQICQVNQHGWSKCSVATSPGRRLYEPEAPADENIHSTSSDSRGCIFTVNDFHRENMPPKGQKITNIVFMGMGEPLANYGNLVKAIRIISDPLGLQFSRRRITVSTCGLAPEIIRLGNEDISVNLAISLNATNNRTRSMLMPINDKYPLEQLLEACRQFPLPKRKRITFEYVLIRGVNDSKEDAERLVRLLRNQRAKVNLIPLNEHPETDFKRPSSESISAFQKILRDAYFTAIIRSSRGEEIGAACGQLRGLYSDRHELLKKEDTQYDTC